MPLAPAGRVVRRRLHGLADRGPEGRDEGPEPGPARARRPLHAVHLHALAVRIAFDVSPLSHPRTGVGNYIRGSLAGLVEAAGDEHEVVPFAPTSPQGKRRIPEALAGIPVEPRLRFLPFAHLWRQGWSRAGWPPVERFLGPVDVLHFSDWMYPPQRGGIRSTMVHDLVPLRFPEWVQGRTRRMHGAKYRNAARTCDVDLRQLGVHRRARSSSCSACAPEKVVVAYPGVGRLSGRGRARRPRAAVRAHGRDARAAQEPRDAARRAAARGPRARRRRRRGLGAAAVARPAGRDPARLRGRRRARAALPRRGRVRLPVALRGLRDPDRRGDGEPACRSSPPRTRRWTRRPATRPSAPTRTTRRRSAPRSRRRSAGATSSSRAGSPTRRASAGRETGRAMLRGVLGDARRARHLAARPDAGRHGALRPRRSSRTTSTSGSRFGGHGAARRRSSATPGGTRTGCRARRAALDVLHCPTFRGPCTQRASPW